MKTQRTRVLSNIFSTWKNMVRVSEGETGTETGVSTEASSFRFSSFRISVSSSTDLIFLLLVDFLSVKWGKELAHPWFWSRIRIGRLKLLERLNVVRELQLQIKRPDEIVELIALDLNLGSNSECCVLWLPFYLNIRKALSWLFLQSGNSDHIISKHLTRCTVDFRLNGRFALFTLAVSTVNYI